MAVPTVTFAGTDINDHSGYFVMPGFDPGGREIEWREIRSTGAAANRQVHVRATALVEMQLPMMVKGTSAADLETKLGALHTLIENAAGAAFVYESATYELAASPDFTVVRDNAYQLSHRARFTMTLIRQPWILGSEVTLLNESAITAPCLTTLGTLAGDFAAPLELTFEANTTDFHALYAGKLAPGSSLAWADLYKEAEDLTWYGGTASAGPTAGASGGASKKNQSTAQSIAAYAATAPYDAGAYLPLLRAAILDTAQTGTVKTITRIGWSPDYEEVDLDEATVTGTGADSFRYTELDQIALPLAGEASGAGFANLWLGMKSSSGTAGHEVALDSAAVVPAAWGLLALHATDYDRDFAAVTFKRDGSVVLDGLEHYGYVSSPGPIVAPPGTAKLAVIAATVAAAATCGLKLTASYTPRYART